MSSSKDQHGINPNAAPAAEEAYGVDASDKFPKDHNTRLTPLEKLRNIIRDLSNLSGDIRSLEDKGNE